MCKIWEWQWAHVGLALVTQGTPVAHLRTGQITERYPLLLILLRTKTVLQCASLLLSSARAELTADLGDRRVTFTRHGIAVRLLFTPAEGKATLAAKAANGGLQ